MLLKQDLEYNTRKDPDYSNPAWAYEMAHINGKRQAYQEIINLLTLKDHYDDPVQ